MQGKVVLITGGTSGIGRAAAGGFARAGGPAPFPQYTEGQLVPFCYYTIEDVRDLVGFIAAVLPGSLDRFWEGRVAKPIDTTPPHLRPKWLFNSPPPR